MPKVLIFDLGNVVITNDWHSNIPEKNEEFSEVYGISEEDMERAWDAAWPDFRVGKVTEDEFWYGFLTEAGAKDPDVGKAKELWRKYQRRIEYMPFLLTTLKPKIRLAALTNISKEWIDYKRDRFGLDRHFETIVSSGYYGVGKPDPRIYKQVLNELGVKGYECLFIDDHGKNLAPARELCMGTVLFMGQGTLEEELRRRGVEF